MQPVYQVTFFKKVTDSTGHDCDVCQGVVEVHADSQGRAIELARTKFAELQEVSAWWLRADRETVELLPARKRASTRMSGTT